MHGPLTTAVMEMRMALGQLCDTIALARTLNAPLELLAAAQRCAETPRLAAGHTQLAQATMMHMLSVYYPYCLCLCMSAVYVTRAYYYLCVCMFTCVYAIHHVYKILLMRDHPLRTLPRQLLGRAGPSHLTKPTPRQTRRPPPSRGPSACPAGSSASNER